MFGLTTNFGAFAHKNETGLAVHVAETHISLSNCIECSMDSKRKIEMMSFQFFEELTPHTYNAALDNLHFFERCMTSSCFISLDMGIIGQKS